MLHPAEVHQGQQFRKSDMAVSVRSATGTLACPRLPSVPTLVQRLQAKGPSPTRSVALHVNLLPNWMYKRVGGLRSRQHRLYSGQFSKSGSVFVSASQSQSITIYNATTWARQRVIEARNVAWTVTSTDLSPDERFLIYSSMGPVVHLANVQGDYELHEALTRDDDGAGVMCAKFSAGGGEVVCGCNDNAIRILDVERKRMIACVEGHADDINAVAFVNSNVVLSGSDDTLVKVWDLRCLRTQASAAPAGVLAGHTEGVTHLTDRGDGVYVLSNAKDQSAKMWDLRKMHGAADRVRVASRHRWDYRFMEYPGLDRPVRHPYDCSVMTYRGQHRTLMTLIRAYVSPLASTGGAFVYTGSATGSVHIYDAISGEPCAVLSGAHDTCVRDVSWHPQLPVIASSSWDGSISLWRPSLVRDAECDADRGLGTPAVCHPVVNPFHTRAREAKEAAAGAAAAAVATATGAEAEAAAGSA